MSFWAAFGCQAHHSIRARTCVKNKHCQHFEAAASAGTLEQPHLHALLGILDGLKLLSSLLQHLPWKDGRCLSQRDLQTPVGLVDVLSSRVKCELCMHVPTSQLEVGCMHVSGPFVHTASTDASGCLKLPPP